MEFCSPRFQFKSRSELWLTRLFASRSYRIKFYFGFQLILIQWQKVNFILRFHLNNTLYIHDYNTYVYTAFYISLNTLLIDYFNLTHTVISKLLKTTWCYSDFAYRSRPKIVKRANKNACVLVERGCFMERIFHHCWATNLLV